MPEKGFNIRDNTIPAQSNQQYPILFVGAVINRPCSTLYGFASQYGEKVICYRRAIDNRPYEKNSR